MAWPKLSIVGESVVVALAPWRWSELFHPPTGAIKPSDRSFLILPQKNCVIACQTQVLGDLKVTKYDGFWGQGDRILWTPDAPYPQDSTT